MAVTKWSRDCWRYRFSIPKRGIVPATRDEMPSCTKIVDRKVKIEAPVPYHVWPDRCECMAFKQPCRHRQMIDAVEVYFNCYLHGIDPQLPLIDQFVMTEISGVLSPFVCCRKCMQDADKMGWKLPGGTWCEWWLDRSLTDLEVDLCYEMITGKNAKERPL